MNELEGMDTSYETSLFQYMVNNGFSPEAAAGILGNIYVETGPKQRYQYEAKQVGGPGRGLFQMEGTMLKEYNNWLKSEDRTNSPFAQIDFMKETIYGGKQDILGRGNARTLRESLEAGDPTVAATAFSNLWERPNPKRNPKYAERTEAAQQAYTKLADREFVQSDDSWARMRDQLERETGIYRTKAPQAPVAAPEEERAWWENPLTDWMRSFR